MSIASSPAEIGSNTTTTAPSPKIQIIAACSVTTKRYVTRCRSRSALPTRYCIIAMPPTIALVRARWFSGCFRTRRRRRGGRRQIESLGTSSEECDPVCTVAAAAAAAAAVSNLPPRYDGTWCSQSSDGEEQQQQAQHHHRHRHHPQFPTSTPRAFAVHVAGNDDRSPNSNHMLTLLS